jgi:hypothetical protein
MPVVLRHTMMEIQRAFEKLWAGRRSLFVVGRYFALISASSSFFFSAA